MGRVEMEKSYAEYQDEIRKALRAMQSRSLKAHLRLLALVLLVAALCLLIRAFAPLVGTVIGAILALGLLGLTAYTLGVARGAICPLCHKPFYVRRYESGFR